MADADAIVGTALYEGNDVTLRVVFKTDGVEETPDSGTALIKITDANTGEVKLGEIAALISGNDIYYKWTSLVAGRYRAYITAAFNSGEDKRTGTLDFHVNRKGK